MITPAAKILEARKVNSFDLPRSGVLRKPVPDNVRPLPAARALKCLDCRLATTCISRTECGEKLAAELEKTVRHPKPAQKGHYFYRQSDVFSSIYIVRSGCVKICQVDSDGDELITGFYLPGELFGMDGIPGEKYSTSAEAMDTVAVCEIPLGNLAEKAARFPQLYSKILTGVCREIQKKHQPLLSLHHKQSSTRLATFLIDLSGRLHRCGGSATEFRLPMPRRDIANYLGMTEETVSRLFAKFQNQNLISAHRRDVSIIDFDSLKKLSVTVP